MTCIYLNVFDLKMHKDQKYLSKLKQHGLPHILSEEFLFKCLSVMIYE